MKGYLSVDPFEVITYRLNRSTGMRYSSLAVVFPDVQTIEVRSAPMKFQSDSGDEFFVPMSTHRHLELTGSQFGFERVLLDRLATCLGTGKDEYDCHRFVRYLTGVDPALVPVDPATGFPGVGPMESDPVVSTCAELRNRKLDRPLFFAGAGTHCWHSFVLLPSLAIFAREPEPVVLHKPGFGDIEVTDLGSVDATYDINGVYPLLTGDEAIRALEALEES